MTPRVLALLRVCVIALALSSGGALVVVDPESGGDGVAAVAAQADANTPAGGDAGGVTTTAPPPTSAPKARSATASKTPAPTVSVPSIPTKPQSGSDKENKETPTTVDFSKIDPKSGELQFEVRVTPTCGKKGSTLTAEVKVPPGSHLSLLVMYSDGSNKGEMYAGPAAPDGSFLYPWTIPATAPEGEGQVFVAAADPATDKSGTDGARFRVGGPGC